MSKPLPRYTYSCSQCGSSVTKKATGTGDEKQKTKAGLHGWQCPKDGAVKVIRKLRDNKS